MEDIEEFLEMKDNLIFKAIDATKHLLDEDISLKTNIEQIKIVDCAVDRLRGMHRKNLIDDTVTWNLAVSYGALLGDMIINREGGHWILNSENLPAILIDNGCQLSPITKIYKIISDDDEEAGEGLPSSLYDGYLALKEYMNMSEEERAAITKTIEIKD